VCPAPGLTGRGGILGELVRCFTPALELDCHSGYELDVAHTPSTTARSGSIPGERVERQGDVVAFVLATT